MTPEIKDMITLAAKAMGYTHLRHLNEFHCAVQNTFHPFKIMGRDKNGNTVAFNPLTSSADSHALMCDLEIEVSWSISKPAVIALHGGKTWHKVPYTTDKAAACRLAILRVAAEIGART